MNLVNPPIFTALTAGVILLLQMFLMIMVGRHRQRTATVFGSGTDPVLQRAIRVHGNLAENAALFLAGFALLELLGGATWLVATLCAIFVLARLAHAVGLSGSEGVNAPRFAGALGTLLVGLVTGGYLVWLGAAALG